MYDISVIITAYNAEKYINESIESIISQTYRNWIIIAVDDGSSDKTYKILNQFKIKLKNQFILIKNKKNLGINISLNKALEDVKTPFFCRQDADDISLPNRLEILINAIKNKPKYYFVSSRMRGINNSNLIFPLKIINYPNKENFITSLPFCNAPTLFRSVILDKVQFNTSKIYKKRFEDYEFFFKCYLNNFFGYNIMNITYLARQDLDYYNKISIYQRFVEVYLKYNIYKKFNLNFQCSIHIILPLIKLLIPNKLIKFYKNNSLNG